MPFIGHKVLTAVPCPEDFPNCRISCQIIRNVCKQKTQQIICFKLSNELTQTYCYPSSSETCHSGLDSYHLHVGRKPHSMKIFRRHKGRPKYFLQLISFDKRSDRVSHREQTNTSVSTPDPSYIPHIIARHISSTHIVTLWLILMRHPS